MIITLAGHVDHGKTSLVRALTGVDTDSLSEEKRRGLTIDLGFAYDTSNDETIGFVDVPGHARFIHNMVAGVASMQFALMVIAADDGPMPQSLEHLQILRLTGLNRGVIAITKCDRVSDDRLIAVEREIAALVEGTFLQGSPIFRTSSETGDGIEALKEHLQIEHLLTSSSAPTRQFRLAIDRAFSVRGSGLVVTGTVHSGKVQVDDEVQLFPSGQTLRVRGLHVQNHPTQSATIGDRTAVNLVGADLDQVNRGHWLCQSVSTLQSHFIMDLTLLEDFPRQLKHWTPVHVYHATTHTTARVALLAGPVAPGECARIELVCDTPLMARRGDQVVLRDQGLEITLGGGEIVQIDPDPRMRRTHPQRLRMAQAYAQTTPAQSIEQLLDLGVVQLDSFQSNWSLTTGELDALLQTLKYRQNQRLIVAEDRWQAWRTLVITEVENFLRINPDATGVKVNQMPADVNTGFLAELLRELLNEKKLILAAGTYRLPGHTAELPANLRKLMDQLTPVLDQIQPPSLGDLSKRFSVPLKSLESQMKLLANKGLLVQVSGKRFYLKPHLATLAGTAQTLSDLSTFSVQQFRDITGVGRNIAIEVLEYFDSKGYTRRNGDTRKVVGRLDLT